MGILSAFELGDLMMEPELTWQAAAALAVSIACVAAAALWLFGKALTSIATGIKALKDAFK